MGVPNKRVGVSLMKFLKATIVGGLLFLVPVVLIIVVLGHAMRLAVGVAQPLSEYLQLDSVGGVGVITVLAVLVLVVVSVVAGIGARTNAGKRITLWFEDSLLGGIPQYQMVKSLTEGLAQVESSTSVKPVLVSGDGGWQIGYLLESLENGWVVVLLPQAPTPMSGNVMYLPADRLRPLPISMIQAMTIVKRMGVGSREVLRGTDLTMPQGA